jgi:hypothetical protein
MKQINGKLLKNRQTRAIIFITALIFLAGCESLSTYPSKVTVEKTRQFQIYPFEEPTFDANLPTNNYPITLLTPETSNLHSPRVNIPTPMSGKSVIFGQMLTPGVGGNPYTGEIYLANLVYANEVNQPPLIKFSETESPKAVVDVEGRFYFENIDPGKYALLVYSLGGTYICTDRSGKTLLVSTEVGNSVDLGVVEIP